MEYLTAHDLVWINEVVTGRVQPYNYVTLELVHGRAVYVWQ